MLRLDAVKLQPNIILLHCGMNSEWCGLARRVDKYRSAAFSDLSDLTGRRQALKQGFGVLSRHRRTFDRVRLAAKVNDRHLPRAQAQRFGAVARNQP
jgi:hypothetical protein